MNTNLQKRIKSFFWRTGGIVLAFLVAWTAKELTNLQLPDWMFMGVDFAILVKLTLGLIFGEISKELNK